MKIKDAIKLSKDYGSNTTLGELVRKVQGDKIYKCPKCGGSGVEHKRRNVAQYWECCDRFENYTITCDLCNGEGYTDKQYKPRMIQDGWEITG